METKNEVYEVLGIRKSDIYNELSGRGYIQELTEQDIRDIVFNLQLGIDAFLYDLVDDVMMEFIKEKNGDDA